MKILLLIPSLVSGGVETGTIDLAKSLKKINQNVIVVSSGGELVRQLQENNIKHIQLPIHKKSLITILQIPNLAKIIRDEGIDLVHAQSRVPAWVAYFACKKTHIPFVTSCHGYYSKHFLSSVMGKGKIVIVISRLIEKHMQDAFGVCKEKIRLVYRGVNLSRYRYQEDKYDKPKDKFKIVNISRITPIKGQREFIRAIAIVTKQIPNIEVCLVGSAEKKHYETEIRRLTEELNLQDKVKFLGRRLDVPEILKSSDLLVLSTQIPEAFGRVVIEAGAVGTAVCATKIGGITEIIEQGKEGILFDCNNDNSMAESIITMLNSRDLMKQCSRNLRKKVEDRFSMQHMIDGTLEVYREAVGEKNILVIKLGGLGDLILATPSLRALRKKFPRAKISLLVYSHFESLLKNCPYIDEIISFDRKKAKIIELLRDLRKRKFGICVDFKNNNLTHLLAFLAKIPSRYGFRRGYLRFLLNHSEKLSNNLTEGPVEQQGRILKKLGILSFDTSLELWTSRQEDVFIDSILKQKGILNEDKLVGMSLEASSKWPTKNWPIEKFSKLSEKLIQQGFKVVILGRESLGEKANDFSKDKGIISFIGDTNLNQLVSLIRRLDILITPDSAPMHIAAALGVKIIALFGPTDPKRHTPPAKNIDILVKQVECQPCYKRRCPNKQKIICLKGISIDEVFKIVKQRIK